MATRSWIGVESADGKVRGVYAHWDGYPEHNGAILLQHYNSRAKAEDLISHGAISVLRNKVGQKHDFNTDQKLASEKEWTTFYGRDRGESTRGSKPYRDRLEFYHGAVDNGDADYVYLFSARNEWQYADRDSAAFRDLTPEVCKIPGKSAQHRYAKSEPGAIVSNVEGLPLFAHKPAPKARAKSKHGKAGCTTVHVKAHDRVVCRGARGRFVKSK